MSAETERQPVSTVEWLDPSELSANTYNPNVVAPPELRLLAVSILEDGWTQPIVARADGEIVDGFHRWRLAVTDPKIAAVAGGLVPVVRLAPADAVHQRMSTIRHNRARGSHHVVRMAEIVRGLLDDGLTPAEVIARLEMESEEVERLAERGRMTERGAGETLSKAWVPDTSGAGDGAEEATA